MLYVPHDFFEVFRVASENDLPGRSRRDLVPFVLLIARHDPYPRYIRVLMTLDQHYIEPLWKMGQGVRQSCILKRKSRKPLMHVMGKNKIGSGPVEPLGILPFTLQGKSVMGSVFQQTDIQTLSFEFLYYPFNKNSLARTRI